jgi:hypothetical protein
MSFDILGPNTCWKFVLKLKSEGVLLEYVGEPDPNVIEKMTLELGALLFKHKSAASRKIKIMKLVIHLTKSASLTMEVFVL